ncbi:MAG: hypothetical protein GXX96_18850 [Planctomycetaceae bacterium]|nr:hypothetical protein [Planctomycetaceae bacterium]
MLYNENIYGDLPSTGTPREFTLTVGSNRFIGRVGESVGDPRDLFTYTIRAGTRLDAVILRGFSGNYTTTGFNYYSGKTWAASASIGYSNMNSANVGTNILPVPSGTLLGPFTVNVRESNGLETYDLDFIMSAVRVKHVTRVNFGENIVNPRFVGLGSVDFLPIVGTGLQYEAQIPADFADTLSDGFSVIAEDSSGNLVLGLPVGVLTNGQRFGDVFPGWTPQQAIANSTAFFEDAQVRAIVGNPLPDVGDLAFDVFRFDAEGAAESFGSGTTTNIVPEPATLAIWGTLNALGVIAVRRRRVRRQREMMPDDGCLASDAAAR